MGGGESGDGGRGESGGREEERVSFEGERVGIEWKSGVGGGEKWRETGGGVGWGREWG